MSMPGNREMTNILYHMLQIAADGRNDIWYFQVLEALPTASLTSDEPYVIQATDGMPYFRLSLPQPEMPFKEFVLDQLMKDYLLENGVGIVLNPSDAGADCILTYGDLLNYHLTGKLYSSGEKNTDAGDADEQVVIGQPGEMILPAMTRNLINNYLKQVGIEIPKVLLMSRQLGEKTLDTIAFNVTAASFANEADYDLVMRTIRWFLPKHYTIAGLDEATFGKWLLPLEAAVV